MLKEREDNEINLFTDYFLQPIEEETEKPKPRIFWMLDAWKKRRRRDNRPRECPICGADHNSLDCLGTL